MRAGIDLYCSKGTADVLNLKGHRLHLVEPLEQFRLGSWSVLPFSGIHDVPCLGFLLASDKHDKIVYLTDSAYCPYRFKNVTHWLVGCNYSEEIIKENIADGSVDRQLKHRIMQTHMSLETLVKLFKENDLNKTEEIHLLHLSGTNSDSELFKRKIQELVGVPVYIGGKDGLGDALELVEQQTINLEV